jgi:hypothetical protein
VVEVQDEVGGNIARSSNSFDASHDRNLTRPLAASSGARHVFVPGRFPAFSFPVRDSELQNANRGSQKVM